MPFEKIKKHMVDRAYRFKLQMVSVSMLLALVSLIISAVGFCYGDRKTAMFELIFGSLNGIFSVIQLLCKKVSRFSEAVYFMILAGASGYIVVNGLADSVFILWLMLFPVVGTMLFGGKRGTVYCFVFFSVLVFLMWTPVGRPLLRYEYSNLFLLYSPLIFLGFTAVSLLLIRLRELTYDALSEAREALLVLSTKDGMTGVYNHAKFTHDLDELMKDKNARTVGFIYIDINGLKTVNDTQSHDAGDKMIFNCVDVLGSHFPLTSCYRVGGDEFVVMLHDVGQEEFNSALEELRADYKSNSKLSVAVGGEFTDSIKNADKAVIAADNNMQSDKALYYQENGIDRRANRQGSNI